jgi:hypothetical protein
MPPTLPPELVAQIYEDSCLDKNDLARLCLVGKDFLDFSRQLLYNEVSFELVDVDVGEDAQHRRSSRYFLSEASSQLLRTFQTSPGLAGFVKSVSFTQPPDDDFYEAISEVEFEGMAAVVAVVLGLGFELSSFGLPDMRAEGVYATVKGWLRRRERPRLDSIDLQEVNDETWEMLTLLDEVQHLSFSTCVNGDFDNGSFPDKLDNLKLHSLYLESWYPQNFNTFHFLTRSSLPSLRSLDLSWDLDEYVDEYSFDFSAFTALSTLKIRTYDKIPSDALIRFFASFPPNLTSLTFCGYYDASPFTNVQHLAVNLPSTVQRLQLPSTLSTDEVTKFVKNLPAASGLRALSVPRQPVWRYRPGRKPKYKRARAACLARGIEFSVKVRSLPSSLQSLPLSTTDLFAPAE